jgi:hypothetical protein
MSPWRALAAPGQYARRGCEQLPGRGPIWDCWAAALFPGPTLCGRQWFTASHGAQADHHLQEVQGRAPPARGGGRWLLNGLDKPSEWRICSMHAVAQVAANKHSACRSPNCWCQERGAQ